MTKLLRVLTMTSSEYHIEPEAPIYYLDCKSAFDGLTDGEKIYVHLLNKSSWVGGLICFIQTSPESPGIFLLLQRIFRLEPPEKLEQNAKALGFTDEEWKAALIYFAAFYHNMGNYKSFGDTKFVPNVDPSKFSNLIEYTEAYRQDTSVRDLWSDVKDAVFSLDKRHLRLGLGEDGLTTYFSANCNRSDAEYIQTFMVEKNVSAYNTRLIKVLEDDFLVYSIRQASAETGVVMEDERVESGTRTKIVVEKGDYAELMAMFVNYLKETKDAALNDTERKMIECYIESFTTGSVEAHENGSRYWIKDKGPIVETYIGFIETYRDPFGVRGEFESFVAVVNKEISAKFNELVLKAPDFLKDLPWPSSYEKDKFLQPDFTSLDIVNFATGGIPVGINIPNYDEIRQSEGFKNVSLGNVLSSRFKDPKVTFLTDGDASLYVRFAEQAFEIQVGLHELIGHGSGKLFHKKADGSFDFDSNTVTDIVNGGPITKWYKPGESWDSKFTSLASPYEECRAEAVGIYLCTLPAVQAVFGHTDPVEADDVAYINWLCMARSGLASLEMYTPEGKAWRQAHSQARYVILQVLLEAGEDLVKIEEITESDDQPTLRLQLDRHKIQSVARPAIGDFLKKLQLYKSTGDYEAGKALFSRYSEVNDLFLYLRSIVLKRKLPRGLIVQCNTIESDTGIRLESYTPAPASIIHSFIDRYAALPGAEEALETIWRRDRPHFYY